MIPLNFNKTMKKPILICLLALLAFAAKSQKNTPPIDSLTHKITYEGVVKVDEKKDQLYDKGLNWLAIAFKSSNDVIQIKDKENGKIVGKWVLQPAEDKIGLVSATITLLFKDGKYKYIITDLYYQGTTGELGMHPWALEEDPGIWKCNMTKGGQKRVKEGTYSQIIALVADLKQYMASNNQSTNF